MQTTRATVREALSFFSYKYPNGIFSFTVGPQTLGFPGGSAVKNPLTNAGDAGLISGSGRSSGEDNGNPLLYSCLGNPMDRRTLAQGVTKSQIRLSD